MTVELVTSFAELAQRPLVDGVNALCWPRALAGDFAEIARVLAPRDGTLAEIDRADLRALRSKVSAAGCIAIDRIVGDIDALDELGCDPTLNCVVNYRRDERGFAIATDLMSFHVDRAPIEVDTWLCTYAGASSEGLDNADAHRLIDDPEIRARMLAVHGGGDDDAFARFVRDGSFDLHYGVVEGGKPFSFGRGNLWRIAIDWPGARVPPCIHRAPASAPGDEPRLLLIS